MRDFLAIIKSNANQLIQADFTAFMVETTLFLRIGKQ